LSYIKQMYLLIFKNFYKYLTIYCNSFLIKFITYCMILTVLSKRHINNKDFFFNRFNDNNHLVENGKVVCGVYIRIVESEKRGF